MRLTVMRYLIERGPAFLREPFYLHVIEDDDTDTIAWSPDKTRALRFASRHDAEVFGYAHLDGDFLASPHPAAELVGAAEDDIAA